MLGSPLAKTSPTLLVLREIRDELKLANTRLDAVEKRQTETETRLATELIGVARAVSEVRDLLRDRLDLRDKLDDHERRLAALELERSADH
jgi:septal ring factor EnvC (AmiA/AmiB activator)